MTTVGTIRTGIATLLAAGLVLAGCGGDDDGATQTTAAATQTTAAATQTTASDLHDTAGGQQDTTEAPQTTSGAPQTTSGAPQTSGGNGGESADNDVCTEERVTGGQISFGATGPVTGLDPVVNTGTSGNGGIEIIALYDTLMKYNPDSGEFEPKVAESLEPNDDFTEWTLALRPEVTFGNGDLLTAEAVKASFERHQSDEFRSAARREAQSVSDIEVVDELTLVFKLSEPWTRFPFLLGEVAGMITNQAVVDAQGEQFNVNPVGAGVGPYEVERFVPGEELVLRAKDDWWGGPVCVETLRFAVISGARNTYDAFRTGDFNVARLRTPDVISEAREDGVMGLASIDNLGNMVLINAAEGRPGADLLVRRALAAAIDPETIDERGYAGLGLPSSAAINPASRLFTGAEGPQYDPQAAADLVEQAKANGWDGSLTMPCQGSPEANEVCLVYKAMLEAVGMSVSIESLDSAGFIARVRVDRDFDIAPWSTLTSDAEPWVRLSALLGTGGALNPTGFSDPAMDAALQQLRVAVDETAQSEALDEIQSIWNETIPNIVVAATETFVMIADDVHGISMGQNGFVYFDQAYIA